MKCSAIVNANNAIAQQNVEIIISERRLIFAIKNGVDRDVAKLTQPAPKFVHSAAFCDNPALRKIDTE